MWHCVVATWSHVGASYPGLGSESHEIGAFLSVLLPLGMPEKVRSIY